MLKTDMLLNIFVEIVIFFSGFSDELIESSEGKHLFDILSLYFPIFFPVKVLCLDICIVLILVHQVLFQLTFILFYHFLWV